MMKQTRCLSRLHQQNSSKNAKFSTLTSAVHFYCLAFAYNCYYIYTLQTSLLRTLMYYYERVTFSALDLKVVYQWNHILWNDRYLLQVSPLYYQNMSPILYPIMEHFISSCTQGDNCGFRECGSINKWPDMLILIKITNFITTDLVRQSYSVFYPKQRVGLAQVESPATFTEHTLHYTLVSELTDTRGAIKGRTGPISSSNNIDVPVQVCFDKFLHYLWLEI